MLEGDRRRCFESEGDGVLDIERAAGDVSWYFETAGSLMKDERVVVVGCGPLYFVSE